MDPCPFVRLIIESLSLKLPTTSATSAGPAAVHPSTTPCFCTVRLHNHPPQTVPIPLSGEPSGSGSSAGSVVFSLDSSDLKRISGSAEVRISVYAGRAGGRGCGLGGSGRRLLGKVKVGCGNLEGVCGVGLEGGGVGVVVRGGWVRVGGKEEGVWVHMVVRAEPDPRFVLEFGGEPECSPVVYQVRGLGGPETVQPVFSCKFSADRRTARSYPSATDRDRSSRERKGWMVTIHDLSGSPVAAASMVTPFVPSPGSDRVSRSNPGAWLILRPNGAGGLSINTWKPWARLEAWREKRPPLDDTLGLKFELASESLSEQGLLVVESSLSVRRGGRFYIDDSGSMRFVMGSTVEGEGRESRPRVEVGVQHVTCMADVALFVALAAAVDLSMDACRLFSRKLRKELCSEQ
ncbi:hypothetical protein QJS10_CPB18g00981 [Acorus calamus]|uniref:Uncharacterized protein n=1 Tax=Acorus calamus TaxID=4465 RepID=A0AAV9CND5_ACOCL|nr:hypothetical protein QJS10_CPB18g00981 [Acorus calamus]